MAVSLLPLALLARTAAAAAAASDGGSAEVDTAAAPHTTCTLQDVTLHYKGHPIDLVPAFRSNVFEYDAILDFSMDQFFVDARPDTGCVVSGVPPEPVPLQIGGNATTTLHAKSQQSTSQSTYVLRTRRLLGSETTLQTLRILGATMLPHFSPEIRTYEIQLDLGTDQAQVLYRLRDGQQRLRSSCDQERPTGTSATQGSSAVTSGPVSNASASANGTGGRRLWWPSPDDGVGLGATEVRIGAVPGRRLLVGHSGEVQFREADTSFMVDVGYSREITLTVQCADATQANIGSYNLKLIRPGCTAQTPYFDPLKSRCVNFCESGYYKSVSMRRCAKCNDNCQICASLRKCQMCRPDTPDYDFVVQPDGSCRAMANHIFAKYKWWCLGFGTLLFFLVLLGLVGICNICCVRASSRGMYKNFKTFSDSEEDVATTYKNRRALGQY